MMQKEAAKQKKERKDELPISEFQTSLPRWLKLLKHFFQNFDEVDTCDKHLFLNVHALVVGFAPGISRLFFSLDSREKYFGYPGNLGVIILMKLGKNV